MLRKGREKGKMSSFFASQPASRNDSGTATPNGSEGGAEYRRGRRISFRSLSEALLRTDKKDMEGVVDDSSIGGDFNQANNRRDASSRRDGKQDESRDDSHKRGLGILEENQTTGMTQQASVGSSTPQKERNYQTSRPTLLRASHSTPLSSTAVNLSPAGGITLHISSLGPAFALEGTEQEESTKSNLFDLMLPREIRLKCFQWLVRLYEEEEYPLLNGRQQRRFFGKEAAVRDLIRLTRVSQTWQSLLLDGQLWSSVDASLLANISNAALLRLIRSAGPFIKSLDFEKVPQISSSLLVAMSMTEQKEAEQAFRHKSAMNIPTMATINKSNVFMSLTHINLRGCRDISSRALHNVLVRLPSLTNLNVSNTDIVTDDTCLLLGSCHPNLDTLNLNRCPNMTGKGILSFIQAGQGALYDKALFNPTSKAIERQDDIALPLKELRIAACSDVDPLVMGLIGKGLRSLQVLDLSYVSNLRDEAIAALVSHPGPTETDGVKGTKTTYQLATISQQSTLGPFITLTPRQAGGNIQFDEPHHRRLLSSLQHISLSSCRRLTDRSCIYLAHSVPNLQYIELANIGANLHDEGLIKLFETIPLVQRIDLEGAGEISEKVLEAVTPDIVYVESIGEMQTKWKSRRSTRRNCDGSESRGSKLDQRPPPPGAYLTHLILSHILKLESTTLLNLIRRCPRLTHLQLDDTKANDGILKEFVSLSRQRQTRGAYISLVDCRALSRHANSELLAQATVRPRHGRLGRDFQQLEYADSSVSAAANHRSGVESNNHHNVIDECDENLIVVKTFFNWEIRSQQRRIQQRRNQRLMSSAGGANRFLTRSRRDSLGAALSFIGGHQIDDGEGTGRWGRITNTLMGQGDEAEDARGCTLM